MDHSETGDLLDLPDEMGHRVDLDHRVHQAMMEGQERWDHQEPLDRQVYLDRSDHQEKGVLRVTMEPWDRKALSGQLVIPGHQASQAHWDAQGSRESRENVVPKGTTDLQDFRDHQACKGHLESRVNQVKRVLRDRQERGDVQDHRESVVIQESKDRQDRPESRVRVVALGHRDDKGIGELLEWLAKREKLDRMALREFGDLGGRMDLQEEKVKGATQVPQEKTDALVNRELQVLLVLPALRVHQALSHQRESREIPDHLVK